MWKPSPTPDDVIMHSAKGSSWKKHKYIAIKNGRYIYPDTKTGDSKAVNRRLQAKNLAGNGEDRTDAYKRSQRKASEHAPHFEDVQEDFASAGSTRGKQLGYRYVFRDTDDGKRSVIYAAGKDKVSNGMHDTHMRSEIEKEDYFAAAASKKSTKNREEVARKKKEELQSLSRMYDDTERRKGEIKREAKKWETAEKSAGIRQKQKEKFKSKQTMEANLDRARAKAKKKKIEDVRNAPSEIRRKQKYNKAMNEAKKEKTTVMREWKRRNAEFDYGKGTSSMDRARQHEKKSDRANITYNEGLMRGFDNNKYEKRKGKKVTNPTAKKNQRKAALEKAKYKAKSTLNKVIGKTKSTVTDTFTGKKRPASKSGTTINIKQLSKKNKKKK